MPSERYYPATLIQVYFNYCAAHDVRPSFEDMNDFISEIQGEQQYNGIALNKISEVFNGIPIKK
jgi:hypothetical protein